MKWIREPLVHFTVLGAVLFLAYSVASDLFAVDQRSCGGSSTPVSGRKCCIGRRRLSDST